MKITIYGAGYVGLVTAACFAELGNHVLCVDTNQERVARLQKGECPIHEPGLPELLAKNLRAGRISFTSDPRIGVAYGFFHFIAVGTPQDEDGSADLQYVLSVANTIGEHIDDYRIIINKSTVPVGTADKVKAAIDAALKRRGIAVKYDVASNPEFLREGAAIDDFMNSDRIIIGTSSPEAEQHLQALYTPFNRNQNRVIAMDVRSAELTKYAANAILATKISFINEMSLLAELLGADIEKIRIGIGSDPRIGYHFINPGCGYGGSCFPKDVQALEAVAKQVKFDAKLLKAVHAVNDRQKQVLFKKIYNYFKGNLKNKVIAVWGLSFKPNTDDMREASSRSLLEALWKEGAIVQAHDPVAMPEVERIYGQRADLKLCEAPEDVLHGAHALVIVTEWSTFFSPDFDVIKARLKEPVIFDGRNLYDPTYVKSLGFKYFAIGRGERIMDYVPVKAQAETFYEA
jgi:UDPglucose 6-dehydrogenase